MRTLSYDKSAVGTPAAVNHDKLVRRIEWWLDQGTPEEYDQGMFWYAEANAFCEIIATELGFTLEDVAQCVAILSPQQSWDTNKRNAVLIATTLDWRIHIFATKEQKVNAVLALDGKYRIPETAIKTFSFADNIANPESLRVTVDRHAMGVALNDREAERVKITPKRYREIERAYQTVARRHGAMPYQIQARTWLTYKRIVGR